MSAALRFDRVSKRYGKRLALDALSFEVPRGALAGFVGHNGAGKTTAFSLVAGYLWPDAGAIDLLGRGPFDPHALKGLLGVLPQDAELPDRHSPRELLTHLARLQGLSATEAARQVDEVLDAVLLTDRRDSRIATLSHGMRRRVAIASALVGRPPLVLLDEPLSGLDPVQARAVRDLLHRLRGAQTVLVSSHDLADLERLCDWVVMLKDGRCLRQGTVAQVTDRGKRVHWRLGPGDVPMDLLSRRLPDHAFAIDGDLLVQTAPEGELDGSSVVVMEVLAAARVPVREVQRGVGLERRFVEDVVGGG